MALVKLPKNVREIEYQTAEGKVRKYQVRMQRRGEKITRMFDTLADAAHFAKNPTPAPTAPASPAPEAAQPGRPSLLRFAKQPSGNPTIDNDPVLRQQYLDSLLNKGFPLQYYLDRYFKENHAIPDDQKANTAWLKVKQSQSTESFFRTIGSTKIHFIDPTLAKLMPSQLQSYDPNSPRLTVFGQLFIPDINHIAINEYIKARKALGRADSTILREITLLSKVFSNLKHLGYQYADLVNPCDHYNRELLKIPHKTARRISEDEMDRIKGQLWQCSNPQVSEIFFLALATAMRRGEIINLRKEQINPAGYIELTYKDTKTKEARKVYLTDDAKHLLEYIMEQDYHPTRLFSITFTNFEKWWQRMQHDGGFDVNFHSVRKESISRLVLALDTSNPLIVGEFLGVGNIKTFADEYMEPEPEIGTMAGVMRSIGHKRMNTTSKHYFTFGDYRPTLRKQNNAS